MQERLELRRRTKEQRETIRRYFEDVEHWNQAHPEQPIDPDPGGALKTLAEGLDKCLENEKRVDGMRRN
jgi:hypothetical protein